MYKKINDPNTVTFLEEDTEEIWQQEVQKVLADFIGAARDRDHKILERVIVDNARLQTQLAEDAVLRKKEYIDFMMTMSNSLENLRFTGVAIVKGERDEIKATGILATHPSADVTGRSTRYLCVTLEKHKGVYYVACTRYIT